MKRLFSIIAAAILFWVSCCPESVYHYIPEDGKIKYNEGDTFIYKCNTGGLDTFVLESINIHYRSISNEDRCATSTNDEFIIYKYIYKNFYAGAIIYNNFDTNSINLSWGNCSFAASKRNKSNYFVNGTKYSDVVQMNYCSELNGGYNKDIDTLFLSITTGVVKYVESNGNYWELNEVKTNRK